MERDRILRMVDIKPEIQPKETSQESPDNSVAQSPVPPVSEPPRLSASPDSGVQDESKRAHLRSLLRGFQKPSQSETPSQEVAASDLPPARQPDKVNRRQALGGFGALLMNIKSKGFFSPRNSGSQPIVSPAPLVESETQQDISKEEEAQVSGPELFTEPKAEWVKISDRVWKGPVSTGLQAARDSRYGEFKKQGLDTRTYMGDPKPWALYVQTPGIQEINGQQKHLIQGFYPFEREVLKVGQTGKTETVSVIANILNGGLQTHEGPDEFFTFGEKELAQRNKRLIVGEPRSEVPTYGQLAEKVYPEQGNKHFWELRQEKAKLGNIATTHMDKEGNIRDLPETTKQLSEQMKIALTYSDYDEVTGFLIPKTFADYRDKLGPLALSKLGRPVGPAVTVFAVIGNAQHLVTWQPFERGTMTTRADAAGNPITEGGLPANDLTAILNNGEEQITPGSPVPEQEPGNNETLGDKAKGWYIENTSRVYELQATNVENLNKTRERLRNINIPDNVGWNVVLTDPSKMQEEMKRLGLSEDKYMITTFFIDQVPQGLKVILKQGYSEPFTEIIGVKADAWDAVGEQRLRANIIAQAIGSMTTDFDKKGEIIDAIASEITKSTQLIKK